MKKSTKNAIDNAVLAAGCAVATGYRAIGLRRMWKR